MGEEKQRASGDCQHDHFRFPDGDSAKAFAKLIAGNDALDVVSVKRESCLVVVSHCDVDFDRGYILGAAQALGAED